MDKKLTSRLESLSMLELSANERVDIEKALVRMISMIEVLRQAEPTEEAVETGSLILADDLVEPGCHFETAAEETRHIFDRFYTVPKVIKKNK